MPVLTTIGYEKTVLDDFIATLQAASVECVIDVRELPLSRKRGFSKTALREALSGAGIRYVHLKALGDPKPGRDAARAGRSAEFSAIYRKHLATPEAQDALVLAPSFMRRPGNNGGVLESKAQSWRGSGDEASGRDV